MNIEHIDIKLIFLRHHFDLKPYVGKNMTVTCGPDIFVIYYNERPTVLALQGDVPYVEHKTPEQLIATHYDTFKVLKYTKIDSITTKEIDWVRFKELFISGLNQLLEEINKQ